MLTIDQAIDKVVDERRARQDHEIPLKAFSMSLDANGENIVGTIDGQDYVPTEHCVKQMATWMGVSHAVLKQYLNPVYNQNGTVRYNRDRTDRELLLALFKNGIRDGRIDPNKVFKFRTYTDGTLRAMLSDRYAIIDNVWYLEHLKNVFGGYTEEPVFEHFRGDADTIGGNLRVPAISQTGNDSDYGGMLFIGNCEIGKRRISIAPAVWRQICTNGMMGWAPGQAWSKVHRGDIDLVGLAQSITAQIEKTIPLLADGISALMATQQLALTAKPSEVIAQVALDHKLTTGMNGQSVQVMSEYRDHERQFRNLFGIVNAVTRAAQLQDSDEQFRLEEIGGLLTQLSDKGWTRLNTIASSMKEETRNKVFGVVSV